MKYYIQNGFNKQLIIDTEMLPAVQKMLKSLLTIDASGNELGELAPLTYVSNYGFMDDILDLGLTDKMDEVDVFRTDRIFETLKRNDIAKHIRKQIKKCPPDVQNLFKISSKLV